MPGHDLLDDGEPQAVAARASGATVVQPGEWLEDGDALLFRHPGAVVFDIDAHGSGFAMHFHHDLTLRMPAGVGDQVLDRTLQIARLRLHLELFAIGNAQFEMRV